MIFLHKKTTLKIGALGPQTLPPGYYVYTGSALGPGGLKARLKHHTNKSKSYSRNFWHIDFLLAHKNATLTGVVATSTIGKLECKINRFIRDMQEAKIPVPGFGASDCKENCVSHLLYFGEADAKSKIAALYAKKFRSAFHCNFKA